MKIEYDNPIWTKLYIHDKPFIIFVCINSKNKNSAIANYKLFFGNK